MQLHSKVCSAKVYDEPITATHIIRPQLLVFYDKVSLYFAWLIWIFLCAVHLLLQVNFCSILLIAYSFIHN